MSWGATAVVFLLSALPLCLSACGQANDTCDINCEDASIPGSAVALQYEDSSCDQCIKQFSMVRLGICGAGKNPNCRCSLFCQSLWEFKY
jgi:hypothetical protein